MKDIYMNLALEQSQKGVGWTLPNPCVGAVIVKGDRILSMGHHAFYGAAHAEKMAIESAQESLRDATLYVTLEPCNHHGKTPPCTEAILSAGIKEVHIAMLDPNPIMRGKSVEILQANGIKVSVGLRETEALKLNQSYFLWQQNNRPYIRSKYAMTLDGKIATSTGDSKWISGEDSLTYTHRLRQISDAILVGVGTVIADNPKLTVRRVKTIRQPKRIVVDPNARMPIKGQNILKGAAETIILVSEKADKEKCRALKAAGAKVFVVTPFVPLEMLQTLFAENINSVLIEGGAKTHQSFFKAQLVDEINVFIAPKCFLGSGLSALEGTGVSSVEDASQWQFTEVVKLAEDVLIKGQKYVYRID